ncbi:MAG: hypothetical protein DLM55_03990 [Acidimicrobiales bacterium]|nr:MAG: hypothetical protein DLM55_03990 [Acidimicrobiales bacterium]
MVHKPSWFTDGRVFVSYAPTVGINKDGAELYVIDSATGTRTDRIDDKLQEDVETLVSGGTTDTSSWVDYDNLTDRLVAVPAYFDKRPLSEFDELMSLPGMSEFGSATLGELISDGRLTYSTGHGSPSADFRTGHIPYIKVSDIRAGQLNINPTNRVPRVVAERFWRGESSQLNAYDLLSPIRTSKNIGDFAVLMPGQEQVVLTKEILVLRATHLANFDTFYLLWALTLKAVRRQWSRIVFMQTNREDVGARFKEIRLPIPPSRQVGEEYSRAFREYYLGTQELRDRFLTYLAIDNKHHVFMSTVSEQDLDGEDVLLSEEFDDE